MKLNEKALEAAAQVHWIDGSFRENAAAPDAVVKAVANAVTDYLDALDAEGLADLHEYWSERVEALPIPDKIHTGDTVAYRIGMGRWRPHVVYEGDLSPVPDGWRVLRRAHQPRQWEVGDLVDDTRDLPDGTIVRYPNGVLGEFDAEAEKFRFYDAIRAILSPSKLDNPRIIWLPENGDES